MKEGFQFMLKALSLLKKNLSFCPNFFDHVRKQLDKKAKLNFKIYDVTEWTINNCNTQFPNILKSIVNQTNNEISSVNEVILTQNVVEKLVPDKKNKKRSELVSLTHFLLDF